MMNLVVLGDANLDVLVALPADLRQMSRDDVSGLPLGGGEQRARIYVFPGGAAATFARVAAAEGASVTLIACVGTDPAGRILREDLECEGIRLLSSDSSRSTGVVISTDVAGDVRGRHTMICDRGANDDMAQDVVGSIPIETLTHLHISGYAFLSPPQREVARAVLEVCTKHPRKITVSVDPPPAALIEAYGRERFSAELDSVDLFFPNEEEARLLTSSADTETAVNVLAARFDTGAVTLGDRGAIAWERGRRSHIPVAALPGVNATGAGDAFAAGFVTSFHTESSAVVAARHGHECARRWLARRNRTRPEEAT